MVVDEGLFTWAPSTYRYASNAAVKVGRSSEGMELYVCRTWSPWPIPGITVGSYRVDTGCTINNGAGIIKPGTFELMAFVAGCALALDAGPSTMPSGTYVASSTGFMLCLASATPAQVYPGTWIGGGCRYGGTRPLPPAHVELSMNPLARAAQVAAATQAANLPKLTNSYKLVRNQPNYMFIDGGSGLSYMPIILGRDEAGNPLGACLAPSTDRAGVAVVFGVYSIQTGTCAVQGSALLMAVTFQILVCRDWT
ncbi:hypothetical protein BDZ88DRAFT_433270 [Geranomyces variabilis]|nr:hypothetical protein BDZ88DRAFT_433270 [Geranomyces variabilis]